jgi:hypothetical protein
MPGNICESAIMPHYSAGPAARALTPVKPLVPGPYP